MFGQQIVTASFQTEVSAEGAIVYLPEGEHEISATVNGKPAKRTVRINETIAAAFARDLQARQSANVRPFGGFDHKTGPASLIPKAFRYESGLGLVLDVEWTEAGRKAIEGRDYSYFSPTFLLDKKGNPIGLPKRGEIGSLVNDPAFEEIQRIAASFNPESIMIDHLIELGLVEAGHDPETALDAAKQSLATIRESASTAETVKASADESATKITDLEAEVTALKTERDELKSQVEAKRAKTADEAIAEAVQAGRILSQDEETKAFWHASITANPDSAKILAAIPGKEALKGETVVAKRSEEPEPLKGIEKAQAAFKQELETLNK
jgi:phage I-like protein